MRPSTVVSHYSCKDWLLFWVPESTEALSLSRVNNQRYPQKTGAGITDPASSRFPDSVGTCPCLSHRSCKSDFSVPPPRAQKPSWWLHHGPPETSLHVLSSSLGTRPERSKEANAAQFPHLTSLLPFWGPPTWSWTRAARVTLSACGRECVQDRDSFKPFPPKAYRRRPIRESRNALLLLVKEEWGHLEATALRLLPEALNKGLFLEWEPQETRFLKTEDFWNFFKHQHYDSGASRSY